MDNLTVVGANANRVRSAEDHGVTGNQVITLQTASEILCCSYSTALRLANSGELRAFRVRGSWRTTTAICEAYIEQRLDEQRQISQSVEVEEDWA